MAQVILIALEKELAEAGAVYAKGASGKALARETDRIDSAARRKGAMSVTSLMSESQAVLAEQMRAEGFDPSKMRLPAEVWFEAKEGLKTVRAVAEYVGGNLNDFKMPNPILRDLKAAEALLMAAEVAGVRFHFRKATV